MGKLDARLQKLERQKINKVVDIRVIDIRGLPADQAVYRVAELEKRLAKQPSRLPYIVIDL